MDAGFSRDGSIVAAVLSETGAVEIFDARTNRKRAAIEDFPAGHNHEFSGGVAFSETFLALGGRKDKPNTQQVQLHCAKSFEKRQTLPLTGKFVQLAFCNDGSQLAVSMFKPPGVLVFSERSGWAEPPKC